VRDVRATARRHVRICRPADEVWAVVGRPDVLHLWFPGVESCRVEGDRRHVTVATGVTLEERILTNDSVQRRFQYTLTGPLFRDHLASIDVIDLDDDTSLVVYATDVDPATMALILGGAAGGALDELRRQVESGTGPAIDAVTATVPLSEGAR
jgi:carbon monoxide dehydrogenase subunit G